MQCLQRNSRCVPQRSRLRAAVQGGAAEGLRGSREGDVQAKNLGKIMIQKRQKKLGGWGGER